MKRFAFVFTAAAIAAFCTVSCKKDREPSSSTPSPLEINVEFSTDNAVALSVSTESGGEYCIGIFEETFYNENTGNIVPLLRSGEGNSKKMSGSGAAVFVNLKKSTKYYACAVLANGDYQSVSIPFGTSGNMTCINAVPVDIMDNAELYMDGLHNFTFRITDAEYVETGEGFGGFWDNGILLEINASKEWKGIEHLPEAWEFSGIYSSDPSLAGKPGYVLMNNSSMRHVEDYAVTAEYEVDSLEFGIQINGDSVTAAAYATLKDGSKYSFTYDGGYVFHEGGYYGKYGYRPLLEEDLENLEYALMKDTYYSGEVGDFSHYSMACVNDPDPDSPYGGYNKHCIRMNILAPHQDNPLEAVPEGTYTITADTCEFAAIEGDYKRIDQITCENVGCYYYNLDEESMVQTMGFLTSGTITITRDGDTYTIVVDASTHDGYKVSGRYQGRLNIEEEPEWWTPQEPDRPTLDKGEIR